MILSEVESMSEKARSLGWSTSKKVEVEGEDQGGVFQLVKVCLTMFHICLSRKCILTC